MPKQCSVNEWSCLVLHEWHQFAGVTFHCVIMNIIKEYKTVISKQRTVTSKDVLTPLS